jgi:hypothetical protein
MKGNTSKSNNITNLEKIINDVDTWLKVNHSETQYHMDLVRIAQFHLTSAHQFITELKNIKSWQEDLNQKEKKENSTQREKSKQSK